MEISRGKVVSGFKVHCDVVQIPTGHFKIVVTTRPLNEAEEREWDLPRVRLYVDQAEAEQEARWVFRSIHRVLETGEPVFVLSP